MTEIRKDSAMNQAEIADFMRECVIPVRLACISSNQQPLVCSLWFLYDDGAVWCATKQTASVVKFLQRNPACGLEVAPETMPYKGVRGQGEAELLPEQGLPMLLRLIDRYLGTRETNFAKWLIAQADDEVAIRIVPDWLNAWDFSARMQR